MKKCSEDCRFYKDKCFDDKHKNKRHNCVGNVKSNEKPLFDLQVGEGGVIIRYADGMDEKIKHRVLELGFVVGELVKLEQKSILGEVLLVSIRGCLISVRREIIGAIYVSIEK